MKRIVPFILTLTLSVNVFTQSLTDVSKTWSNLIYYLPNSIVTEHFMFGGSVQINELDYLEVLRTKTNNDPVWSFYGYIREADGKVWYKKTASDSDLLIYDFSAELHDTVDVYTVYTHVNSIVSKEITFYVSDIDSIEIGGSKLKQMHLKPIVEGQLYMETEQWIESVGSMSGLLHNYNGTVGEDAFYLLCYHQNNELLYMNPSYSTCHYSYSTGMEEFGTDVTITVMPNPVSDVSVVHVSGYEFSGSSVIEIYDYKGSLVDREQMSGDYTLPAGHYTSGIYLYRISDVNGLIGQGRFIVR